MILLMFSEAFSIFLQPANPPGCLVARTSALTVGLIPGWGLKSHKPQVVAKNKQNNNNKNWLTIPVNLFLDFLFCIQRCIQKEN